MHSALSEPCRRSSWGQCWLALAPLARLCLSLVEFPHSSGYASFDVSEFDIFDFDRLANGSAECRRVTINLMESIVPPRFGAGEHAVEPFETIELIFQGSLCHIVDRQPCFVEHCLDGVELPGALNAA